MPGEVYTVSTSAELLSLMRTNPDGGIEIRLQPGRYDLNLSKWSGADITYNSTVKITSADPDNPAVFTSMKLADAAKVSFDNLVFDMTAPVRTATTTYNVFSVDNSRDISITNSLFDGDIARNVSADLNGYGIGVGLVVRNTDGMTVSGNEMRNFFNNLAVRDSKNVVLSENDIHSFGNDGIKIAAVQGLVIENNWLHDPHPSPRSDWHNDMIQFYTQGTTTATRDVVVRGNVFDIGESGTWTQTIFFHNEEVRYNDAGARMYYRDILIEDNVIYNSHLHGVYVDYAAGVTIRNNTMVQVPDSKIGTGVSHPVWIPGIAVGKDSTSVIIEDNITGSITTTSGRGSWVVGNNIIAQNTDPSAPNFYEDLFVASSLIRDANGHNAWIITPGGTAETAGAGSPLQHVPGRAQDATTAFDITMGDTAQHTLVFDATMTLGHAGAAVRGTTFLWDFGDGTTATGPLVRHSYADTGNYQVTLTVTQASGTRETATATARVTSDTIVSYSSTTGTFTADRYGQTVLLANPPGRSTMDLGATGVTAAIARDHLLPVFDAGEFSMSMTLKADTPTNSHGEIMRLHNVFTLSVDRAGDLVFTLTTTGGTLRLTGNGPNMLDGTERDISLNYDSTARRLEMVVDGTVVASGALSGNLPPRASWGIEFGNPWNQKNFDGKLSAFDLVVPGQSWYEDYRGNLSTVPDSSGRDNPPQTEPELPLPELPGPLPEGTPLVDLATILGNTGANTIALSGAGVQASWSRGSLSQLYDAPGFDLSFDIRADGSAGNQGNIVMMHQMFALTVNARGNLVAQVTTQEGTWRITTTGINLNDRSTHEVRLAYDSTAGLVQLLVDDVVAGTAPATGRLITHGYWDLSFGNPWVGTSFVSRISEFSLGTSAPPTGTGVTNGQMPVLDDYVLDIAAFTGGDDTILLADAASAHNLGRIADFIGSDRIGISMDFARNTADGSSGVLLASGGNLTVSVEGDGILIRAVTAAGTTAAFRSSGLGLNSTDTNNLVVLLDTTTDQLQVIVNDRLVIDETSTDFIFSRGLGQSWNIGSPWADSISGLVSDFRLDSDFNFVADARDDLLINA